jgi:N-acetyl-anhydromuramyl-L-alanine amidase AmpD
MTSEVFLEQFSLTGDPVNFYNSFALTHCLFDIGVRVVKWSEAGGFSHYAENTVKTVELNRRTGKDIKKVISGRRYSDRQYGFASIRQMMIHHTGGDGQGAGRVFNTLHNRKLSVHFVIDDDGTAWQFLDSSLKAWHGGGHNDISVGFECCLFPLVKKDPDYYSERRNKRTGNLPHKIVEDRIHGQKMEVFAFTDPQVDTLARLCAGHWIAMRALSGKPIFDCPPMFPRGGERMIIPRTVVKNPKKHIGLIGHLQCTKRKIDPAGFPWEEFEELVEKYFAEFSEAI